MSRRWCRAVVLGVFCAVVVVSACGRRGSAGPASSVSSVSVSSASSVSSVSVSLSQDELYAEAERVYRALFELEEDAYAAGGAESLPLEMNQYVMQPFAGLEAQSLSQVASKGWRSQPGTRSWIAYVRRSPEITREDSVATLSVCVDSSQSPLVDANGAIVGGGYNAHVLFFKYDMDGSLKIYGSTSEAIDSCNGN